MTQGRPYDGSREPNADYFDDYMGDNDAPGMFAPGMKDYDRVNVQKSRSGLVARFHCRGCSSDVVLDVEWHELYMVSMMPVTSDMNGGNPLVPQGWTVSDLNRSAYPAAHCGKCGTLCALHFTPSECRREIESAIESRVLSEDQLKMHPAVQQILYLMAEWERRQQAMAQQMRR